MRRVLHSSSLDIRHQLFHARQVRHSCEERRSDEVPSRAPRPAPNTERQATSPRATRRFLAKDEDLDSFCTVLNYFSCSKVALTWAE